ncbi:MAG: FAD-dependent oxidoreductase [Defluviitaleaceae bacterium]|nr:FAD-dependent oxidoreductase [Defluviitaleaceae bacterium]
MRNKRAKNVFFAVSAVLFASVLVACANNTNVPEQEVIMSPVATLALNQTFTPGTFTGVGEGGYGGTVTVDVTFTATEITDIYVVEHNETEGFANLVIPTMTNAILENQSTNIDVLAGATLTSTAMLNAVANAITLAGTDPNLLVPGVHATIPTNTQADVVVVGAGLSGLTAAIHAAQNGASVVVIEKLSIPGGSSAFAWGGIAASETLFHEQMDEMPSAATNTAFIADLMNQGASVHPDTGYPFLERVEQLVLNSHLRISWLYELGHEFGVSGRSHGVPPGAPTGDGAGTHHINFLMSILNNFEIPIYFNTRGVELVTEDDAVTGVVADTAFGQVVFNANDAVILATGGFSHNQELMERFVPNAAEFVQFSIAGTGSAGDGIIMAEAVGAVPWPYQWPLGFGLITPSGPGAPFPRLLFGPGNPILVNYQGNRFVNEQAAFSVLSNAMIEHAPGGAFKIFDSSTAFTARGADGSVDWVAIAQENIDSDYIFYASTLAGLAQAIGIPAENLIATNNDVGTVALSLRADTFGRSSAQSTSLTQAPFFAIHYVTHDIGTKGGVITDMQYRVLDENNDIIPGLFAVGEMSNRPYWNQIYIAGTALSQAISSGAIAGTVAAGAPSPVIN